MALRNKKKKLIKKRQNRFNDWMSTKKMLRNFKMISNTKKTVQNYIFDSKNREEINDSLGINDKLDLDQDVKALYKEKNKSVNIFNLKKGINLKKCIISEKSGIRKKTYNQIMDRIKFKNIILFIKIILLMNPLQLFSCYNWYSIIFYSSKITLTIRGTGTKNIFGYDGEDIFNSAYYPDEVYINNELQDIVNYNYAFEEEENIVELYWYDEINNTEHMFKSCSDITEFDLSEFDTSQIIYMKDMLSGCSSLTSLDVSNFVTSNSLDMNDMFSDCSSLTSLDLSNFDTSKVTRLNKMFSGCTSLTSLDLSNFITSQVTRVNKMFYGCTNLRYINLQNFDETSLSSSATYYSNIFTSVPINLVICIVQENSPIIFSQLADISCKVIDCSDDWKDKQKKLKEGTNECLENCQSESLYEYNSICYESCPGELKGDQFSMNCVDECYSYQFEYENICYNDCPGDTHKLFDIRSICVEIVPENYYLDNDQINKKCYDLCQKCSQSGTSINNNCDECINEYTFLDESSVPEKNCFKECDFYYYFNQNEKYTCTTSNSCPSGYDKIINEKNKCIDDCKKDDEYKYDYSNNYKKKCPDSVKNYEEEKICLDECYSYLFEYENICYNNCPSNTHKLFNIRNICVEQVPENYYLDSDQINKKCYDLCKKCSQSGNTINNNCDKCINEYIFLNDSYVPSKIVIKNVITIII